MGLCCLSEDGVARVDLRWPLGGLLTGRLGCRLGGSEWVLWLNPGAGERLSSSDVFSWLGLTRIPVIKSNSQCVRDMPEILSVKN